MAPLSPMWLLAGVWPHERKGKRLIVEVESFGKLSAAVRKGTAAEAERLAAFLGGGLEPTWV